MVAAREATYIFAAHGAGAVAVEKHRRDQANLIDVVALLPATHFSPGDLVRRAERIERISGDSALVALVGGDAEIAELELLVLADEDVERSEVAVHRLATVQSVERLEDGRDLAAHEALGLASFALQPDAEISVCRILQRDAVSHAHAGLLGESVKDTQRARLAKQKLGEVGFAEPAGHALGDLDADLRR